MEKKLTFKVEMLVIRKSDDTFCSDVRSFNNLIKADSSFDIKNNKKIVYNNKYTADYKLKVGQVTNKNERYFYIELKLENDIKAITEITRGLRKIITKTGGTIQILWDDTSSFYSNLAYPLVNEIENMMRLLILKFMLINSGEDWEKIAVPDDVKQSVNTNRQNKYSNILFEVDFIQLSYFLFKSYSDEPLINAVSLLKKNKEIKKDESLKYIPRSNWERYFSSIVECEDTYLEKRWKTIYELRCLVAHNNWFHETDYKELQKNINDIKKHILKAIKNIDKINVPDDEKELIAENTVLNLNERLGNFLITWKRFELRLLNITQMSLKESFKKPRSVRQMAIELEKNGKISHELVLKLLEISDIRNKIVHHFDVNYSEFEIQQFIGLINNLESEINSIN